MIDRKLPPDSSNNSEAKQTLTRVLVVDDDPTSLILLQSILINGGFDVVTAENGAHGYELAHQIVPDIIIMDINMPGEDGVGICGKLKNHPLTQDIPVIFITVVQDLKTKIAGFKAGALDYITKPYEPDEVLARVNLQVGLRLSEQTVALQAAALDEAKELIVIVDANCRIFVANKSCEVETRCSKEELKGQDISFLLRNNHLPKNSSELRQAIVSGQSWVGELHISRNDGSHFVLHVSTTAFQGKNPRGRFSVVVARDITQNKTHQSELERQARQDCLTGLLNRKGFIDHLRLLAEQKQDSEEELALLYVDLDKFKLVNDTLGHSIGDELLIQAANRLSSCVRDSDVAARIGGDEFAILLRGRETTGRAQQVAERILANMDAPISVSGHELAVSASIGISVASRNTWDPDTLIKNADTAMYAAKQSGRNRYLSYSDADDAEAVAIAELKRDLVLAIGRGEFEVYYQPIVDVESLSITSVEALLRWNHPVKGLISPGVFIPIAEQSGMMSQIGNYVLREACSTAGNWKTETLVTVAINVSLSQANDLDFVNSVLDAIANAGLVPQALCLEFSEVDVPQLSKSLLRNLAASGVNVAIDNYQGNGIASHFFEQFKSIRLKLDGSLLLKSASNQAESTRIESIIRSAHHSHATVVAQWVETQDQFKIVKSLGFDLAQGYAICAPVEASALADFLECDSINFSKRAA